jgi:hypothetical protein
MEALVFAGVASASEAAEEAQRERDECRQSEERGERALCGERCGSGSRKTAVDKEGGEEGDHCRLGPCWRARLIWR